MTDPDAIREDNPAPILRELEALREAVHRLRSSIGQLESAQADAAHPQLFTSLGRIAELRRVGVRLVEEKAEEDGFDVPQGAATGVRDQMRRRFRGLRSAILGDQALLRSLVKAERETQRSIHSALDEDLPSGTHHALRSASRAIDSACAQLEAQIH